MKRAPNSSISARRPEERVTTTTACATSFSTAMSGRKWERTNQSSVMHSTTLLQSSENGSVPSLEPSSVAGCQFSRGMRPRVLTGNPAANLALAARPVELARSAQPLQRRQHLLGRLHLDRYRLAGLQDALEAREDRRPAGAPARQEVVGYIPLMRFGHREFHGLTGLLD